MAMQMVAAAPIQRLQAGPTCRRQSAAVVAGPSRTVSRSSKQHAVSAPRRQLARQAAAGGWRQQRAVLAAAAGEAEIGPQDFVERKIRLEEGSQDFAQLTQQIEDTAAEVVEGLQGTSLYLIGMMGSGKSTVGKLVSTALGYCFFDTDALIEQLAQRKVSEIFAEDGEESFREAETQVLAELAPFKDCVIATGGGVPTRAENWGHMQGGVSVWLNGPPTLLAHRVVGDGTDSRPLLSQDAQQGEGSEQADAYHAAVERLTQLLEQRQALYRSADIVVSLEGTGPDAELGAPAMLIAFRVLSAINQRVKDDAEERRRRMDFEIVREELPSTMRVVESPAATAAAQQQQEDPFLP